MCSDKNRKVPLQFFLPASIPCVCILSVFRFDNFFLITCSVFACAPCRWTRVSVILYDRHPARCCRLVLHQSLQWPQSLLWSRLRYVFSCWIRNELLWQRRACCSKCCLLKALPGNERCLVKLTYSMQAHKEAFAHGWRF